MVDSECPDWEYTNHPNYPQLPGYCKELLIGLRKGDLGPDRLAFDTRPSHKFLFENLTPDGYPHYAGNYRGERLPCLKFSNVGIRSDRRVGVPAENVFASLALLWRMVEEGFSALDRAQKLPNAHISKEDKVYYLVVFACRIFVDFLTIHPYVNGNGHIARLLIWAILGKYGLWPKRWPLNDRPPDPPYSMLISEYRDGHKEPLEKFVLKCILGEV